MLTGLGLTASLPEASRRDYFRVPKPFAIAALGTPGSGRKKALAGKVAGPRCRGRESPENIRCGPGSMDQLGPVTVRGWSKARAVIG